jgi:hypothetical protein
VGQFIKVQQFQYAGTLHVEKQFVPGVIPVRPVTVITAGGEDIDIAGIAFKMFSIDIKIAAAGNNILHCTAAVITVFDSRSPGIGNAPTAVKKTIKNFSFIKKTHL